jgi:Chitobiase/beta-hexosaminidase C-terminal domain
MAASRIGLLFLVILVAALATLAGCGFSLSATAYQTTVPLRGSVHGGNQPVTGASVQFYAAGTSGPGSAALPLLSKPVQSDSNGNFSIPPSLICPSSTSQVYVVARGGKPGTLSGGGNPALELTAMLGSCNDLSTFSSISVNEVTTVGSVWPLAAFMTSPSHLGYESGDASFLNAVSSVPEFINIAQGNSPGKPTATSYFAENSKLYSLANVLADCVNSSGGSAGDGSPCGLLFSIATLSGGNAPTDTMTAAMRIAQNPHNNVLDIFGLAKADTSYQPTLTSAPPDWTLTLTYLVATPSISLGTGSYVGTQEVTISDSTAGSAIHYTTDGTVPTSSSPLYAGPLSIAVSTTVQAIAVLEGSQSAIASSILTITSAHAPVKLAFLQQPSNALAGATISPAVQVAVEDSSGTVVTSATDPVTLTLAGGTSLAGTLTAAPRNGVATFSNLSVNAAGAGYTLSATSPGLASAISDSFTITASASGAGAPPAKLAFLQQPSNALTGATISPAVQVAVEDSSGKVVTSATDPITLTLKGGTSLAGTLTAAPRNGVATFSNLSVNAAGAGYTLSASSPGLSSATSASFTITASASGAGGSPAKLAFLQQPSNALTGATISPAVQVAVEDSSGNAATTATNPVTVTLVSSAGLQGAQWTATPQNGIATFSKLTVSTAGSGFTLVASSPTLASTTSISFTISASAGATAPLPAKLAFLQQPSNALAGATISPAVQVVVEDNSGNVVTTATNPVTLALVGGSGLTGTLMARPQNGIATFSDLSVGTAGSGYTLSATSPSLTSATSTSFTINAQAGGSGSSPVKLAFLVQPSNALTQATISPAVQVAIENGSGNTVTTAGDSVTVALTNGSGLGGTLTVTAQNGIATFSDLTLSSAGNYTLSASSSGLSSATSASFTVSAPGGGNNASPVKLAFLVQPSNALIQATISPAVQVAVENANGNIVTAGSDSITLSLTNGSGLGGTLTAAALNGVATFSNLTMSAAGSGYMLLASSPGLTSATSASFTISAPSLGNVQPLGVISASQPLAGLGFNIDPLNEWEFQLAAKAGTTHVRFQCGWNATETQTAPPQNQNTATPYVLPSDCQSGLAFAKQYGMHPTIIAAYGSPYHTILSVAAPGGASAGSTSINVQFSSGVGGDTMASLAPFTDTVIAANGSQISARNSYAGTLITGVNQTDATHATLTLASALTSALPANSTTLYTISEYLHPPAATFSPSDPSVIAFAKYAQFLAQSIAAAGLTGDVELWNEPPWSPDPWDERANFYDTFPGVISPGPQGPSLANWGFVAALQGQTPIPGVTYTWAGTNKSGDNSVLNPSMLANTGVAFTQPATTVTSESLHPYTNNPEDSAWSESCLEGTIKAFPLAPLYFMPCNLVSTSQSNSLLVEQESLVQKSRNSSWGVAHDITETGFSLALGDTAHQARYTMRIFLAFQAAGVTPLEFYRLYDSSAQQLTFTDPTTQNPLPSYTAIAGLMSDLGAIKNPAAVQSSNLASIVSYAGSYLLDTVHIVGARPGDTANSEIFAIWQQSTVGIYGKWGTLAQPNPAPVTIEIPAGSVVSTVLNLDTRQPVSYTTSGQQITLDVSDDPIEVLVVPMP